MHKKCYGKCNRCAWKDNGGCNEWNSLDIDFNNTWNKISKGEKNIENLCDT